MSTSQRTLCCLENFLLGDMILADRGFTIQESAGMYCAEVRVPAFTKGKKQLSKVEIETARQLSTCTYTC